MKKFKCRVCNKEDFFPILDLGAQPWGNDYIQIKKNKTAQIYPLIFGICKSCITAQINFTIPKEKMFLNHTYLSATTKSLKNHFVTLGKEIIKKVNFDNNDYILDIGGNDGTFLEFFLNNNIKVQNIDSGILQSKISNEKNIPCLNKFFNKESALEIINKQGQAKVIHGSGIFFHLEELHSVFDGVKTLLKDKGVLVAEFIYLPLMLKNCSYDQIYHEHLLYYSLYTFQNLLNQFDLEIFDASIREIHGGSCMAFISHKGHYSQSNDLKKLIDDEHNNDYDTIESHIRFKEKAKINKEKLISTIKLLRKEGKSIQALGAPVKGSTIINFCELNENDIECGVEINPYKFNTYFPGTKIPVFDQSKIKPPDIYLLLAWNFKSEILLKLTEYRKQGGKILIPIPEIELI